MKRPLLSVLLILAHSISFSQEAVPEPVKPPKVEKGWFFFEKPPAPPVAASAPPRSAAPSQEAKKPEDKCKNKESWSADCGFVNPGTDFEFQSKQRDALMERMSVAQNDPKAVEAVQYYMRWVLERTTEVSNLWWYNMVQNPELDPNVKAPITTMGLRLMTDVRKGEAAEINKLIKDEGGFYVYFSRSDCSFCHQMKPTVQRLANETGLEVRNASLDKKCIPGLEQGCVTAPDSMAAAQALQVTTVPSLFLFVQPNTWLRVATGVVDGESIRTRTIQFFNAYRTAVLNGVDNGSKGRAPVDFSTPNASGTKEGVEKTSDSIEPPTEADIKKFLQIPSSTK